MQPDAADVARGADRLPVDLGQAVGEPLEPFRGSMRLAVVAAVDFEITEAEIGGEVDDAVGEGGEVGDAALGFTVRQRQEEHVARGQLAGGREPQRLFARSLTSPVGRRFG